jgi:hypothetical protein
MVDPQLPPFPTEAAAPVGDDLRVDDQDYNPNIEPGDAKAWLNLLEESEQAFEPYNDHCDKIDKIFASLERLSNLGRDKEFQIFWANMEVIKPAIYANPPIPVVVPKFKDRRPLYQAASEVMERTCIVAFDLTRINDVMMLIRDDVAVISRGVAWCRYESGRGKGAYGGERVCIDFKPRRDFLHSISRNWREVTWVAAASYLTRTEARTRFRSTSGDEYQDAEYRVDKDTREVGGADNRERAKFWEIWDKAARRVVWVAKGCKKILDEDDPHLDLLNFFPCPMPAYGTVQRGSLVPVPDAMQYRDQLDEINLLTGRIHALSDALEVKGFYPAGGAELADAIQTAVSTKTAGRMLVPVSNWAAFGSTSEVIVWLPIDQIATTIQTCVQLRGQLIDDIYQITGLADIMRGDTDPNETLGAQQLKTQYGSSRIRDKQQEIIRIARDLVEISSEIITEKFSDVTIIEMSQTQLPTTRMIGEQIAQVQQQMQAMQQQLQMAQQNPQVMQMAQQNPQQAQAMMQQAQQMQMQMQAQIQQLQVLPTIEQVLKFLKDTRAKSFVLDIETNCTIQADENAEKALRGEFIGMLSQLLPQLAQMIASEPKTAQFCGELIKFAVAPFRAGRSLDGAVDDLVQLMEQKSSQPPGPDPTTAQNQAAIQIEQMKISYQKQRDDADRALKAQQLDIQGRTDAAKVQSQSASTAAEVQGRAQEHAAKIQEINARALADQQAANQDIREHQVDTALEIAKQQQAARDSAIKAQALAQRNAQQQFGNPALRVKPPGGRLFP